MVQYSADLKDLPKSSGIYIIKNAKTKKVYVGSSIDITSRVRNHIKDLNRGIHHSMKLQRSFNKHGHKCSCMVLLSCVIKIYYLQGRSIG